MAKVLPLEGPHKHHHDHGKNASVPAKGNPIPGEHWEKHYSSNFVHDKDKLAGSDWNPKKASTRTCTHVKVNECDH